MSVPRCNPENPAFCAPTWLIAFWAAAGVQVGPGATSPILGRLNKEGTAMLKTAEVRQVKLAGGEGTFPVHYDAEGVRINFTCAQVDVYLNKVLDDAVAYLTPIPTPSTLLPNP